MWRDEDRQEDMDATIGLPCVPLPSFSHMEEAICLAAVCRMFGDPAAGPKFLFAARRSRPALPKS